MVILGGSQDPPPLAQSVCGKIGPVGVVLWRYSVCLWQYTQSNAHSVAIGGVSVAIWLHLAPHPVQQALHPVQTIISATKTRGSVAILSTRSPQHPVGHLKSHHYAPVRTVICTFLSDIQSINHTNPHWRQVLRRCFVLMRLIPGNEGN